MRRREFVFATTGAILAQADSGLLAQHPSTTQTMKTNLLAGVAVSRIVPDPKLVNNSLHGNMTVRFDERGSELRVKALVLQSDEAKRLLLALDIVGIPSPHAQKMREAIAKATSLADEDIVITASHSHSTPF